MPTSLECMQFATGVYAASDDNKLDDPIGWQRFSWQPDQATGFSAGYYFNSQSNEVVISYTGTNDFMDKANWLTGFGLPLPQIYAAVDYYFKVKSEHPDANITFTGHSLGGGLASLMAVYFDKQATVFDEAPFQLAAISPFVLPFVGLQMLIAGYQDSAFSTYLLSAGALALTREANVSQYYVEGEVLSKIRFSENTLVGSSDTPILMGNSSASAVERHSMALMTALQYSPAFLKVVQKLPDLVTLLLNNDLFAADANDNTKVDLLRRLLRHQLGVKDAISPDGMLSRFTADMNKLAQDGGLTMNDGQNVNNVSKALTAFAMQMYYEVTANASNKDKQLFTTESITGGVQFDIFDVSKTFQTQFEADGKINLDDAKGYKEYFAKYLSDNPHAFLTPEDIGQIKYLLPYLRDWYVQAGADGMTATDTQNRGAFMLGGNGGDTLTGGTADDLLVGNAGADTLAGGEGHDLLLGGAGVDTLNGDDGMDMLLGGADNDTLNGGKDNDILNGGDGNDTYVFTGDYGVDIITDSDGSGSIQVGGQTLGGGTQTFDSVYKDDASGQIFVKLNGGQSLVILKEDKDNRILVNNWPVAGTLGITLQDKAPETPTATLTGDFKKAIDTKKPEDPNDDAYKIVDGNYVKDGDEANAKDLITGTAAIDVIDVIDGGGGDDALSGREGDDYIMGGTGCDIIQGGLGKDTIYGGSGDDAIYGSSDADLGNPTLINFTRPNNTAPHPQGTGFNWFSGYTDTVGDGVPSSYSDAPRNRLDNDKGNIIDGGIGNDFIAAGTGADIVHGGAESDRIYGMDKGDVLFGDGGNDMIYGDGNQPGNDSVVWTLYESHGNDVIDGGSGNDYLVGQGGGDIIFGGDGEDYIWGDDEESDLPVAFHGNDFLFGGDGVDQIIGGGGNDYIEGGLKDDLLIGGTGNDVYYFDKGDGEDKIYDNKNEKNIIRFGAGVDPSKLHLHLGSLMLDVGDGDAIHIEDFDQNDAFNSSSITHFEFADGTSLSLSELLARGFDLDGSDQDESIFGTNADDRIDGKGGTDTLSGGAGNDTYIFRTGDSPTALVNGQISQEWVQDTSGVDTVQMIDVDPSSIKLRITPVGTDGDSEMLVEYGTSDRLLLLDGANGAIERFEVGGETMTLGEFVGRYAANVISGTTADGQALLNGGKADDLLTIGLDGAILSGGLGNDTLKAYGNGTIIEYSLGDGTDQITTGGTGNVLRLGAGIALADVGVQSVGTNALTLKIGSATDDVLHFANFDLDNPSSRQPFDDIQFADGSSIGFLDFIAQGFTMVGTSGDDVVYGLSGNDDLDGEAGNDTLVGGAGSDTYRFGAGSGQDTIESIGNGSFDSDTLAISDGLLPEDLVLLHRGNDLIVRTSASEDQVMIKDYYLGGAVGTITFGDGTTWNDLEIDTRTFDMFVLNRQQGSITVQESSALGAIVQLGAGIAFSDVSATRADDDLLLQIRGTQDSLKLQNYYTSDPALWSLTDATGSQSTLEDLVNATTVLQGDHVAAIKQDYVTWARLQLGDMLAGDGFDQGSDGLWHRSTSWMSAGSVKYVTDQTKTTYYHYLNGWPDSASTTNSQSVTWSGGWYGNSFALNLDTASVAQSVTEGVASVISTDTFDYSSSSQKVLADVHWTLTSTWQLSGGQNSSWNYIYGGNYSSEVIGVVNYSTTYQGIGYQYIAAPDSVFAESSLTPTSISAISAGLPGQLLGSIYRNSLTYTIQEIDLTDGNHQVYADPYTMVIAGNGNAEIYNAGFAYGGTGNSSLYGGHILVAGEGDQTLQNGDVMVVGNGEDLIIATTGNTIQIRPDNLGVDFLKSNANQSVELANQYYSAQGISDWQERYQYGGQYRCEGDGNEFYVNSAREALQSQGWQNSLLPLQELIDLGRVTRIEPLPELVTFAGLDDVLLKSPFYEQQHIAERKITALNFDYLQPIYDNGTLMPTTVKFGEGLSISDLNIEWTVDSIDSSLWPFDTRAALSITWGSDQGIEVIVPNSGDAIGQGAYDFVFADGAHLNLPELIALAPPAPDFNPDMYQFGYGYGNQTMSDQAWRNMRGINVNPNLNPSDISATRDGYDMVISSGATDDQLRLTDWYGSDWNLEGQSPHITEMLFGDGTVWTTTALTRMACIRDGSAGNLTLSSNNDGFATTFIAGPGDTLIGGRHWGDVYVFGQGMGEVHIQDGGLGTVRFEAGITPDMLTLDPTQMRITVGSSGDVIYLDNVDSAHAGDGLSVQMFEFTDGTFLTYDQLAQRGWDIHGTDGDDDLEGTGVGDRIYGGAGNDTIEGGYGEDVIVGGTGNDTLDGGSRKTTYVFNEGDDQDVIDSLTVGVGSTIRFGPGIALDSTAYDWNGSDLTVYYGSSDDAVTIKDFAPNDIGDAAVVENFLFDDGTLVSLAQFLNLPPSPTQAIPDQALNQDEWIQMWLPENLFVDDSWDSFVETLTVDGVAAESSWLRYDPNERLLTGRPGNNEIGGHKVTIYATDSFGATDSVSFQISVANVNDAPLVSNPLGQQTATEGSTFTTSIPVNTFEDVDVGDALTYNATLADGSVLPSWLAFNAMTRTFAGIPTATDVGTLQLSVSATDSGGLSAAASFQLDVFTSTGVHLVGTSGPDTLTGTSGNDNLNGGARADTLIGGTGDDIYTVENAADQVIENADEGNDLVRASVSYTLSANVERLTLTGTGAVDGTGNALDNILAGNSADNVLSGGDGNDSLNGGAGADMLTGGMGDDIYTVDSVADQVIENADEGNDLVRASISYTLSANVEKLTLTGTGAINGAGNALDNILTGSGADNVLSGGDGNDSLNGGAGADMLIGGTGDDIYTVENVGDQIIENTDEGNDLVRASVSYALSANVEKLTLTGTEAIDGTGNALDNILTGNGAGNVLSGGDGNDSLNGGAGADMLIGGTGDDIYTVENVGDQIIENANEGNDLVRASVSHTLSANVKRLTLIGTEAIDGTGNALDNILTGNGAGNVLSGGDGNDSLTGGAGADTLIGEDGNDTLNGGAGSNMLIGGRGDDIYVVSNSADFIVENANEGTDWVKANANYTLLANVEKLILTGTEAINGAGNALDNILTGNATDNMLSGGDGNDTLNGGAGTDILEGGIGNDVLTDTSGSALFNGGAGADILRGGAGAEIFLGGLGNDTITTAAGNDIILFNKGDGQDTFATGGTGSDVISLGGGISYADLIFTKSSNDLVLKIGATDQITFKNWYAATPSKPVANLQVIAEAMTDFDTGGSNPLLDQNVENFNFAGLVGAFDAARTSNAGLTSWALTNALTSFQLAGSDTAGMGGDLAYQYGRNGTLAGIGITAAQATLSDTNLGTNPQALTALAGLQTGSVRLS